MKGPPKLPVAAREVRRLWQHAESAVTTFRPSALSAVLLLSACSSDSPPPPPIEPEVQITADNALEVASAVYRGAFDIVRTARIAGSFFDIAPPAPPDPPAPPEPPESHGATGASAILTQAVPGPEGGTAIYSWDDADGDGEYSSDDRFTISFAEYGADGLQLTGTVLFDRVVIQGNVTTSLTWIMTARMSLLSLALTRGADTVVMNGPFAFGRERRATVSLLTLAIDREFPYGASTLGAGATMGRNDYSIDFRMGLLADGVLDVPDLGGKLLYATQGPLMGIQVLPDPSDGLFEVRGAGGSQLWLVPVDFFNVEVQVDEDGDGIVDVTLPVEWSEL